MEGEVGTVGKQTVAELEVGDGICCPEGSVQLLPHTLGYVHTHNFCKKCGQQFL